jgi:ribonucleoside-diphosphate reductase alpha chain
MLSEYVFTSKYARFNGERRETWDEAVDRMMDMHIQKASNMKPYIDQCRVEMKNKLVTGSQRALQFGGEAIFDKNMRIYNCVSSYADRPRFFAESLWLLLCGCGVGFSVQKHHVDRLPAVVEPAYPSVHVVEDSIEGWADAVDALFSAYLKGMPQPYFNFSEIRPKGSSLRFGGKAPGPDPLKKALDEIEDLLRGSMGERLTPLKVFDCVMYIADSVLSAGIRRSATIATFDIEDTEMLECKTGNWFEENPQRGRANISAIITSDTQKEKYDTLFEATKEFGEPAIIFMESTEYTVNPCVEIMMCPTLVKDPQGEVVERYTLDLIDPKKRDSWVAEGYTFESGWQSCNLSTINMSKVESSTDLLLGAYCASVLGTIQASYTDVGYLTEVSKQIMEREYLTGVSLCGIMDSPKVSFDKKIVRIAAEIAVKTNKIISEMLGTKPASRVTCVKPEGTSSIVLGASSGIHPHHAKKYIRRVQANMDDPVYKLFAEHNPSAIEDSVWGADKVISFPIEAPEGAIVKDDLTAIEFLEKGRFIHENWVLPGTQVDRLEKANHNVSITVSVKPDEWLAVRDYLWGNRRAFCGVSMLPSSGDYDYVQAPFQSVEAPTEQSSIREVAAWMTWNCLRENMEVVDYSLLREKEDNTNIVETIACSGNTCTLI